MEYLDIWQIRLPQLDRNSAGDFRELLIDKVDHGPEDASRFERERALVAAVGIKRDWGLMIGVNRGYGEGFASKRRRFISAITKGLDLGEALG